MRVFKTKHFNKWALTEGLGDIDLCSAAGEAFNGQVEADLGGLLFKKRIKRTGFGKSGGYRTIIGFRKSNQDRIFFLFGFAKNRKANISVKEHSALSIDADALVRLSDAQIAQLLKRAAILELECKT